MRTYSTFGDSVQSYRLRTMEQSSVALKDALLSLLFSSAVYAHRLPTLERLLIRRAQ